MKEDAKILKSVLALMIGIFSALIISEAVLKLIDFPDRPVSGWQNCKIQYPEECNSLGFRGQEIAYAPDDYVVLLLGDSEVFTSYFPFEQMPERRLENYLKRFKENVKVFTIGDMGYGQDQQYLALKEYYKNHRADLVLLMFTARNDVNNNLFPTSGGNNTIKPTFWINNDELLGPTEGWLNPAGSQIKLILIWELYVGRTPGESRLNMWMKNILPPPYQPLKQYQGEVDYSWQERWNESPQTAFKGIESERVGRSGTWTPRSKMREYGIDLTRKLLLELKELTETNHGHFIIFKEERPWELQNPGGEKVYILNGNYYKTSITQYQENLREIFNGFEHYIIPLNIDGYTVKSEDFHLSQQAVNKLMDELAIIISKKEYFRK